MRLRYSPFYGLLLVMLAACASLAPTTWNQRILAAYNLEDAVVQSVQTLVAAGKVSKAEAQSFHDKAIELKNAIDLADQMHGGDPMSAENQLDTVIRTLQALQVELNERHQP